MGANVCCRGNRSVPHGTLDSVSDCLRTDERDTVEFRARAQQTFVISYNNKEAYLPCRLFYRFDRPFSPPHYLCPRAHPANPGHLEGVLK